jgi:hypothetical protein
MILHRRALHFTVLDGCDLKDDDDDDDDNNNNNKRERERERERGIPAEID